jgi:hypothetical protein
VCGDRPALYCENCDSGSDRRARPTPSGPTDSERLRVALRKAIQLAQVASDWNLDEVEIDGKMVPTDLLYDEFDAALRAAGGGE